METTIVSPQMFMGRPHVQGTMKSGFIKQSKIYFIPKKKFRDDPSFIQKQYDMLKTLQSYYLPSLRSIRLLRTPHFPVLMQQYIPSGRIIKPHQDEHKLFAMIEAFAKDHTERTVRKKLEKMRNDIETMIRVFSEQLLLVEDLQLMVSSKDLSLRIVDPLSLVYLRPAEGQHGTDQKGPFIKKHFGRKYADFQKQQSDLIRLSHHLAERMGVEPVRPMVPSQSQQKPSIKKRGTTLTR